ncbi:MAG: MBL fold metallo-hydrolase [Mogibacterium sp.]|nr:MBL fold metallo-hydrolase [Mogibacterium sp.]
MDLGIISIGSSSSGNSYIITNGRTHLLLDAGLSAKKIREALVLAGISEKAVQGVLITHEHTDHIQSIRTITRVCENAVIVSSRGTAYNCDKFEYVPENRRHYVAAQDALMIGDIGIKVFALSHDAAEPVSYSFSCRKTVLTVVTDTGTVTDEIFEEIKRSDLLVLEANHEVSMLEMGPYPYQLKRRILSDRGHLSNVAAGETLARMLEFRMSIDAARLPEVNGTPALPQVMLAHLSTHNTTPANASVTVRDILWQHDYRIGEDYGLGIAAKDQVSDLMIIGQEP